MTAVTAHAAALGRALARYDHLTGIGLAGRDRFVLTHGEPHPANTMRVDGRFVLIDWESALIAPPERDLWNFAGGDPEMCELYSLRWALVEAAGYLSLFRRDHRDGPNEGASWRYLTDTLAKLETTTARI
ncbi:hypothetical protein GCM10009838_08480 [Catenulispora subtropica]|uniref:Aminoglycoside phosphotransferase domain-containing protein n=1 Tax=Catenulispora subtropica TaxID=450798 RepID=A0ABN2QMV2_9ACTN